MSIIVTVATDDKITIDFSKSYNWEERLVKAKIEELQAMIQAYYDSEN